MSITLTITAFIIVIIFQSVGVEQERGSVESGTQILGDYI